jgi:hypothetical protein
MRRLRVLAVAVALLAGFVAWPSGARPARAATHTVTFDKYSLILDGHRLVLWSGEFHALDDLTAHLD